MKVEVEVGVHDIRSQFKNVKNYWFTPTKFNILSELLKKHQLFKKKIFITLRGVNRDWNSVYTSLELFWNSLYNAPSSIVFYLKMRVQVEVGVHDIISRFTPRVKI